MCTQFLMASLPELLQAGLDPSKENLWGIVGAGFHWPDVLLVAQPTMSEHWREHSHLLDLIFS